MLPASSEKGRLLQLSTVTFALHYYFMSLYSSFVCFKKNELIVNDFN